MATAGTIVLELQANTAQFQQQMGRARGTLAETKGSFSSAEHAAARFAAQGLGTIIPGAEGAEVAIHRVISSALRAGSAFRLLAGAAIGVGVGFALVKAEQKAIEFLALGKSVKQFEEDLKKAAEEQQKFFDRLSANIKTTRSLARESSSARGQAAVSGLGSVEDEEGAIRQRRENVLEEIAFESAERIAAAQKDAVEQKITAEQLANTITEIKRAALSKQLKASQDASLEFAKLDKSRADASISQFTRETEAMLSSLKRRLDLRKELEDRAAGLVESGDIADPQRTGEAEKKRFAAQAEGFATLLQQGRRWVDLEEQIFAKDQEFQARGITGFAQAVKDSGERIRQLGADNESISKSWDAVNQKLSSLQQTGPAAAAALDPLILKFQLMQAEAFNAARAIQFLDSTLTSRVAPPAPIVTAPVDLGQ